MQKEMITRHILKTDFGVTAELELDEESGDFNCAWEGLPKDISHALREKILSAYVHGETNSLENGRKEQAKSCA